MNKSEKIHIIVIVVVSLVLLIVDLGRTFAYFVINGEIVTSTLNGMITIDKTISATNKPFTNVDSDSHAVLITGGTPAINSCTIDKSGNGSGNSSGTNSAVFVNGDAGLSIRSTSILTDGDYADGVYADGGRVTIVGGSILTKARYSNGIVVSNNGSAIANYVNVETLGDNSSAIVNLSGNITVNGGSYKTSDRYSPVVKAMGDVTIDRSSSLISEKSEGIVIDGHATVTFDNSRLETNNTVLSDGISKGKSILLYQSSVRDDNAISTFNASGGNMITHKGATFYITNTRAVIKLVNNVIVNDDGEFMRVEASSFGTNGSNGGDAVVNMSNQSLSGNVIVDDISKLEMNLENGSKFEGSINKDNQGGEVNLNLSNDSIFSLTEDTYISSLNNEDDSNSNIHLNGHDLYINGEKFGNGTGDGNNAGGDSSSQEGTGTGSTSSTDNGQGTSNKNNNSNNSDNINNNKQSDSNKQSNNDKQGSAKVDKSKDGDSSKKNSSSLDKDVSDKSSSSSSSSSDVSNDKSNSKGHVLTQEELDAMDREVSNSSSIYVVDDKTLIIINVIGIVLIVTSVISFVRLRTLKKY